MKLTPCFGLVALCVLFQVTLSCDMVDKLKKCLKAEETDDLVQKLVDAKDEKERNEVRCEMSKSTYLCRKNLVEEFKDVENCKSKVKATEKTVKQDYDQGCGKDNGVNEFGSSLTVLFIALLVNNFAA